MTEIIIIDSNSANLSSVYKAVKAAGLEAKVSDDPKIIRTARALIFPGVGSFGHAVAQIKNKGLHEPVYDAVAAGKPFLGICLGMQLLLAGSEEAGCSVEKVPGLNIIPGFSKRFPAGLPVPHVGWNLARPVIKSALFAGLEEGAYFYFTHSFYVVPANDQHAAAKTSYGLDFVSAIQSNNLFGVQFHPEKSGPAGLRLIRNFGKIIADRL
ncbi:MAG: imidazole glycerol phosphate synthase subunit HisH [Firmicutes bacterium]|nr:imidazole glycerol phosphate synthase subunit HisH [Bacillota bacterium]